MQYSENMISKSNRRIIFLIIILFVVITAIIIVFLFQKSSKCGNDICEKDENCVKCFQDCKCSSGEYCSQQLNSCVKSECGNNNCEPIEDADNCCLDCDCYMPSEICNTELNKCEHKEINLTDENAMQIARTYFENDGKNVTSVEVFGIFTWKNKLGKSVIVYIEGENFGSVFITENEELMMIPNT
jgi:hypothetical protein